MTEHADKSSGDPMREVEIIGPDAALQTRRPPGRRPVAPLHVIAPLTAEEISGLTADPNKLLRRRAADYLTWAHNLISASPSRLNRVAFGVESQRRMIDKLLSLAIPPARQALDPFGEMCETSGRELVGMLMLLGKDRSQEALPEGKPNLITRGSEADETAEEAT